MHGISFPVRFHTFLFRPHHRAFQQSVVCRLAGHLVIRHHVRSGINRCLHIIRHLVSILVPHGLRIPVHQRHLGQPVSFHIFPVAPVLLQAFFCFPGLFFQPFARGLFGHRPVLPHLPFHRLRQSAAGILHARWRVGRPSSNSCFCL